MIIGVTGAYASGKDTVADMLQKMNFYHISLSDILRDELRLQKKKITRENLINIGNQLRTTNGANVLARRALRKTRDGENYVFTSIRNPKEVEYLMQREDFIMVNVIAPDKVRLRRIQARNREEDPKTLKELKESERKENTSNPNAQQLNAVAKMAKIVVKNDSDLAALQNKVEKLVKDQIYKLQDSRPNWDEYFMNIAEVVKKRCSCMSAKKGAIVVKNRQILSTGYNGTAKGINHCTQGSCPRCSARHLGKLKSGDYSVTCICAHAEENAIVQAAYNGISTKGATLYTTFTPCSTCARMIINAGIVEVVARVMYPDSIGTQLLKDAKVKLRIMKRKKSRRR